MHLGRVAVLLLVLLPLSAALAAALRHRASLSSEEPGRDEDVAGSSRPRSLPSYANEGIQLLPLTQKRGPAAASYLPSATELAADKMLSCEKVRSLGRLIIERMGCFTPTGGGSSLDEAGDARPIGTGGILRASWKTDPEPLCRATFFMRASIMARCAHVSWILRQFCYISGPAYMAAQKDVVARQIGIALGRCPGKLARFEVDLYPAIQTGTLKVYVYPAGAATSGWR